MGAGHHTLCDKHVIHLGHGLDYEDLARARNVMWFEIKIKWIQKIEFEFI